MTSSTLRRTHRILLVDDDPLVVKVYSERMRFEGWTVAVARDGWEASSESKRERFDVILLDIRMPLHDGLDVLREIREGEKNKDTPVWILTSMSTGDEIEDSLRLGANGVFHKAIVRPDDLVTELQRIFNVEDAPATTAHQTAGSTPDPRAAPASALDLGPEGEEEIANALDRVLPPAPSAGESAHASAPSHDEPPEPITLRLYVNPFLGDGADLAKALGREGSLHCEHCGGQICLVIYLEGGQAEHEAHGLFVCDQCGKQA